MREFGIRVKESPLAIERYHRLKSLAGEILGQSQNPSAARRLLAEGAKVTNPSVWASFWEHTLICPVLGRKLAEESAGYGILINPQETEVGLWVHELGRLVVSGAFYRNDLIDYSILRDFMPRKFLDNLPSTENLMKVAKTSNLDDEQLSFKTGLTPQQTEMALDYFNGMTPNQRIVNLADNLGKRGPNGLFTLESFISYLESQEQRYVPQEPKRDEWPSISWAKARRRAGAVLQAYTVKKTVEWLRETGVDFDSIIEELRDYGPKFVVVARHGELDNPNNIVYNRDEVMNPEDVIHLNEKGRIQMRDLASLLVKRGFKISNIVGSPHKRAEESVDELKNVLGITNVAFSDAIKDVYAPGPYREGMTMKQLQEISGDIYDKNRWGQYDHENQVAVIVRMKSAFWAMANQLKAGETGLLLSHGDPIAWLVNTLDADVVPSPEALRSLQYPGKGEAVLVVIHPDGSVFTRYILRDESIQSPSKIY